MSDSQSYRFFSMQEHANVSVRATEFADTETGLKAAKRDDLVSSCQYLVKLQCNT